MEKEFRKHLQRMEPKNRRGYLLWLLNNFKVDISRTPRVAEGGMYKYSSKELCEKNTTTRRSGRIEVPIWKSVTKEKEFETILSSPSMPWIPRSGSPREEFRHLMSIFKTLFRESRRSIFISIRNSKITHWVPFYKATFINEKLKQLKTNDLKVDPDKIIDGCDIIGSKKTEYQFGQYYDMFTKTCRSGNVADCDFFINLDFFPKLSRNQTKFGIMLLSPCSTEKNADIPIPTPDEWEKITGQYFTLSCSPRSDKRFEKSWANKRSSIVFRAGVRGCNSTWKDSRGEYRDTPLKENSRESLVRFLRKFNGLGVNAGLEGQIVQSLKIKDNEVYLWPERPRKDIPLYETEYDKYYIGSMDSILMRSGTISEQREIMDIIAKSASNFAWWPAVGPVPGGGTGRGGLLAGGKAYKKAMELFWRLNSEKVYYGELKKEDKGRRSPMISSPNPDSPPFVPTTFGSLKKKTKKRIAELEEELEMWVEKARKEKYYIHGKGQIEVPRQRARPVGGLIAKKGLKGMKEFWKQNGVGGSEERENIIKIAQLRSVMAEPLSYEQESKYKFVVVYNDVPGIMEFHMKASMGSLLLVFGDLRYQNWFWGQLRENVHYIRVDRNNFGDRVRWCLRNEDQCREIADNLKKFVKKNFTENSMIEHIKTAADVSNYLSR